MSLLSAIPFQQNPNSKNALVRKRILCKCDTLVKFTNDKTSLQVSMSLLSLDLKPSNMVKYQPMERNTVLFHALGFSYFEKLEQKKKKQPSVSDWTVFPFQVD